MGKKNKKPGSKPIAADVVPDDRLWDAVASFAGISIDFQRAVDKIAEDNQRFNKACFDEFVNLYKVAKYVLEKQATLICESIDRQTTAIKEGHVFAREVRKLISFFEKLDVKGNAMNAENEHQQQEPAAEGLADESKEVQEPAQEPTETEPGPVEPAPDAGPAPDGGPALEAPPEEIEPLVMADAIRTNWRKRAQTELNLLGIAQKKQARELADLREQNHKLNTLLADLTDRVAEITK